MDWIFTLSFSLVLWGILTLLLEHLHTTGSIIFFGMQRNSLLLVIEQLAQYKPAVSSHEQSFPHYEHRGSIITPSWQDFLQLVWKAA